MADPERPWAVFVSGSRDIDWGQSDLLRAKLDPFAKVRQSVLIHGAGEGRTASIAGCDRVVDDVWRQEAWPHSARIIRCPALWNLQSMAAGPIRNRLCAEVLSAHEAAGYRLAFLAFSTGGAGTADAIRAVERVIARDSLTVQQEKIDVVL